MKKVITICALIVLFCIGNTRAEVWTSIDKTGATKTVICDIDGSNLVGLYDYSGVRHGFLYDGTNWTTLDPPGATKGTYLNSIHGNIIAGYYGGSGSVLAHSCVYNKTSNSWTTIDKPGSNYTEVYDFAGDNFVGGCDYANGLQRYGFVYNMPNNTWTTYDMIGATNTSINHIDGNKLLGAYSLDNAHSFHGLLINGATWTTFDYLGASSTYPTSIEGDNIVGYYVKSGHYHGFLYSVTSDSWTTLDMPGATDTIIRGIQSNHLVGSYYSSGKEHGFICTIPEPATLLLFGLGAIVLRRKNIGKKILTLGLMVCILTGAVFADLNSGLVAYYPFSGNANDATGNGHNGTVYGAVLTYDRFGTSNSAYSFDGIDDYIDPTKVVSAWSQGTVGGWVKFDSTAWSQNGDYIFRTGTTPLGGRSDPVGLGVHAYYSPNLVFGIYENVPGIGWHWANSGISPSVNTWYHVVGTWGSAGLKIYVDGVLKGTNAYTGSAPVVGYNTIGRGSWPGGAVEGTIDEVVIYNRALSADEVAQLYRVPEPATLLLLGLGITILRRKK